MCGLRIFLNTQRKDTEGINKELIGLLKYFENSTASTADSSGSSRVIRLHEKVRKIKENEEIGVKFMNAWEEKLLDRQDGYNEGLKKGQKLGLVEGESRKSREVAIRLKERGMSASDIANVTGLSISEVNML